jgi:tRNA-dihydrouridine synthase
MAEVAEHPYVDVSDDSERAMKLRRDHESAQREAVGKMKQFASWFTHGVPGGANLRRGIFEAKRGEEVMGRVDAFFAERASSEAEDAHAPLPEWAHEASCA